MKHSTIALALAGAVVLAGCGGSTGTSEKPGPATRRPTAEESATAPAQSRTARDVAEFYPTGPQPPLALGGTRYVDACAVLPPAEVATLFGNRGGVRVQQKFAEPPVAPDEDSLTSTCDHQTKVGKHLTVTITVVTHRDLNGERLFRLGEPRASLDRGINAHARSGTRYTKQIGNHLVEIHLLDRRVKLFEVGDTDRPREVNAAFGAIERRLHDPRLGQQRLDPVPPGTDGTVGDLRLVSPCDLLSPAALGRLLGGPGKPGGEETRVVSDYETSMVAGTRERAVPWNECRRYGGSPTGTESDRSYVILTVHHPWDRAGGEKTYASRKARAGGHDVASEAERASIGVRNNWSDVNFMVGGRLLRLQVLHRQGSPALDPADVVRVINAMNARLSAD